MCGDVCVEVVLCDTARFCDVMCATHIDFIARFFAIHFNILIIILQSLLLPPCLHIIFKFRFWFVKERGEPRILASGA